jgi:N-acetylneuraminate synthase
MNNKIKIIAEIGINANGDIRIAKKLIDIAAAAGCDYVKFQKRTPELCIPKEQRNIKKETPWGEMTYFDYKLKTEFNENQYDLIDRYCIDAGIKWFASVWDNESVDFLQRYKKDTEPLILKIPSAHLINEDLIKYARKHSDILIMSTGMSTEEEIIKFANIAKPDVIMHTCSTYPSPLEELNLNYILHLNEIFSPNVDIGYSGHEYGLTTTFATVPMGVKWIERHITLNRNMWGSDQKSSIEPSGLFKLVKGIRDIEVACMHPIGKRILFKSELDKLKTLRKK